MHSNARTSQTCMKNQKYKCGARWSDQTAMQGQMTQTQASAQLNHRAKCNSSKDINYSMQDPTAT